MRVLKTARIFLITLVSVAAVAGIHAVDARRQQGNETALSLRWARQMVTQTESLALAADARGERDPLTWAARLLSQGTDSRIIFASKAQVPTPVKDTESYSLDPATGIFDYTKIFDVDAGTGIRIRLYTARTGIFGAKTVFQHDLTVAALFLLIYGFLFVLVEGAWKLELAPVSEEERVEPTLGGASDPGAVQALRAVVTEWESDAKKSLAELGGHIRELVRGASELAKASRETKENIYALRLKVHAEIEKLHATSRQSSELTGLATRVEAALSRKKPLDPEAQSLLKDLLGSALQHAERVADTEVSLEPIATDADLAFGSLEAVDKVAAAISAEIKHTTQGMVEQSRKLGDLKKRGA